MEIADGIDGADGADSTGSAVPMLRVVRGEPTTEELAALIAVIAMRGADGDESPTQPRASGWTDRSRYIRVGQWHIADGWRTSAYPQ